MLLMRLNTALDTEPVREGDLKGGEKYSVERSSDTNDEDVEKPEFCRDMLRDWLATGLTTKLGLGRERGEIVFISDGEE